MNNEDTLKDLIEIQEGLERITERKKIFEKTILSFVNFLSDAKKQVIEPNVIRITADLDKYNQLLETLKELYPSEEVTPQKSTSQFIKNIVGIIPWKK